MEYYLEAEDGITADRARLSPGMIAGSDKGSNTEPFADLDKDKDRTEEN